MNEELTKEIAYKALQNFFQEKPFVLFGTGTSCAVHQDYGMPALRKYLLDKISRQDLTAVQQIQWDAVTQALDAGKDLESAMDAVRDANLICRIVRHTAELVISLDREHGQKVLLAETDWPAVTIFRSLVTGRKNDEALHVATPNYDLLAEYAFEQASISYTTGFVGGVCRRLDWPLAGRSLTYPEKIIHRGKSKSVIKHKRHIRLYKVHGSLNTFKFNNGIVENNAWMFEAPDGIERVMITAGTMKYERLLENRSDLLNPSLTI